MNAFDRIILGRLDRSVVGRPYIVHKNVLVGTGQYPEVTMSSFLCQLIFPVPSCSYWSILNSKPEWGSWLHSDAQVSNNQSEKRIRGNQFTVPIP